VLDIETSLLKKDKSGVGNSVGTVLRIVYTIAAYNKWLVMGGGGEIEKPRHSVCVADPDPASFAFLTPASGMEKIRIQDPRSINIPDLNFEIFRLKNT
jgi:hypothetical protein